MAVRSPASLSNSNRDIIDPTRLGEYPILLGDSLKEDAELSLLDIRYNWLPKIPSERTNGTVKKATDRSNPGYTLHLKDRDRRDHDYFYNSSDRPVRGGQAGESLVLVFDKTKSAFILESLTCSMDFNLTSASGQSRGEIQSHPQLPSDADKASAAHARALKQTTLDSDIEDDDRPSDNPYDWRHFIPQVKDNVARLANPGSHTPLPGNRTPISGTSSPQPGATRFHGPGGISTPPFRPVSSGPIQKRKRDNHEDKLDGGPRSHPVQHQTSTLTKKPSGSTRKSHKPSNSISKQPLSKEVISSSESDSEMGTSTPPASRAGPSHSRVPSSSTPQQLPRSPHIVLQDDPSGLEIDMGSPPPETSGARRRHMHVNPDAFASRSHGGTPRIGASSPLPPVPRSSSHHQPPKPTHPPAADNEDDDAEMEDADVEHLTLGPPVRPPAPAATAAAAGPAVVTDDEDDDFANQLEAAMEEADDDDEQQQQEQRSIGLGIKQVIPPPPQQDEEESEVSEEE